MRAADILVAIVLGAVLVNPSAVAIEIPGNHGNPQAVQEVVAGERTVANAAWWGFNEEDATEALQSAIDSGATRVIVPNMTRDWIVRPITLAGDQELVLEEGVVVTAKRGEYRGGGDTVLTARDVANLTLRGYGATVRMHKKDYIVGKVLVDFDWERWYGQYKKAEWRSGLALLGCTNVAVAGLTIRDTGGDGIYIDGASTQEHCRDVRLRDVVCDENYRQGISIISVEGMLVENCAFNNTWGTPPSAGVDIEPDSAEDTVKNVVFRNCLFEDNYGDGIEVYPLHMSGEAGDITVLFENCRVTSRHGPGIRVSKVPETAPAGLIEFRNCVVENTQGYGIKVQDKSANLARVRFVSCIVRNAGNSPNWYTQFEGARSPIWLHLFRPELTEKLGGIDFVDCVVEDDRDRPVIVVEETDSDFGIFDITGTVTVRNPYGVKTRLGEKQHEVTLVVKESGS